MTAQFLLLFSFQGNDGIFFLPEGTLKDSTVPHPHPPRASRVKASWFPLFGLMQSSATSQFQGRKETLPTSKHVRVCLCQTNLDSIFGAFLLGESVSLWTSAFNKTWLSAETLLFLPFYSLNWQRKRIHS